MKLIPDPHQDPARIAKLGFGPVDVIVGIGGGGGWLCTLLSKSEARPVILVDGDIVTESNLSRQFYGPEDVGQPKVARMLDFLEKSGASVPVWSARYLGSGDPFFRFLFGLPNPLRIFACVDNHVARRCCMELADRRRAAGLEAIVAIAGNEKTTASADIYLPEWEGGPLDFRVRYPEVATSMEDDPRRPAPCTGEEARKEPQLALYNATAALAAVWLMDVWTIEEPELRGSDLHDVIVDRLPVSLQWAGPAQKAVSYRQMLEGA